MWQPYFKELARVNSAKDVNLKFCQAERECIPSCSGKKAITELIIAFPELNRLMDLNRSSEPREFLQTSPFICAACDSGNELSEVIVWLFGQSLLVLKYPGNLSSLDV